MSDPITRSPAHSITRFLAAHFVAGAAIFALLGYASLYGFLSGPAPIQSDGYSYYVYLPSWFIYHDVSMEALARDWYSGTYPDFTGLRHWPTTGRWMNLHPIGTAILMSPFFSAGHLLTRWSNFPADGFSVYYQHSAALAGLAYFLAGLALTRRMLTRHFSEGVVLATLVCLTWGTNLFHYGVAEGTFSHAYAFFLICLWMWLVEAWWNGPSSALKAAALGSVAAMIVLTRHTNAIYLIVLPMYGLTTWHDLRARPGAIWRRRGSLMIALVSGAVLVLPQLALYKWISGSWLVSPYDTLGVGFNFRSPHVIEVLFSTQKGLFFWSPLLLLALPGAIVATGWARGYVPSALLVFAAQVYLVACWFDWQFGGSYGHRAFTDGFGLVAPMLAACFAWAASRPRVLGVVAAFAAATVLLSIAQMVQYWMHILPIANTTWAQYRTLFLQFQ